MSEIFGITWDGTPKKHQIFNRIFWSKTGPLDQVLGQVAISIQKSTGQNGPWFATAQLAAKRRARWFLSLGRCRIRLHAIVSTDFRVQTKLPTTKVHTLFFTGFDPSKCPATFLASSLIPPKMDGTCHDSCQNKTWATKKKASDTFHWILVG